jgi:hypothetical protein
MDRLLSQVRRAGIAEVFLYVRPVDRLAGRSRDHLIAGQARTIIGASMNGCKAPELQALLESSSLVKIQI